MAAFQDKEDGFGAADLMWTLMLLPLALTAGRTGPWLRSMHK